MHGLSGSTRWWSRNISDVAERYRIYLVDLPGFGKMRRLRRGFVLAEAASWLSEWMDAVGLERVHLVGHSMGGYICLRLAASQPGVVRRLVLVAPAGVPTGRSMVGHLGPLLGAVRYAKPSFLPVLVRDALRMGPATLWRAARELLPEDVREDLRWIEIPTLLVWGERDPLLPPAVGDLLREEIAESRLVVLERAAHVPMFDRPEEFDAVLLAFLAGSRLDTSDVALTLARSRSSLVPSPGDDSLCAGTPHHRCRGAVGDLQGGVRWPLLTITVSRRRETPE